MDAYAIVAKARELIGTPYHHQARLPGIGMDCAGPIVWVGQQLGFLPAGFDVSDYGRQPTGQLDALLSEWLEPSEKTPGAIVGIRWHKATHHLGIVGEHRGLTLIHALQMAGGVREHSLHGKWAEQITGVWKYKGAIL